MSKEYFDIKDNCRKGLYKYFKKAISIIPSIETPLILDIGCGSGVITLALAEEYNCTITAIDIDAKAINRLEEKVKELDLSKRVNIVNCSLFDMELEENLFDIIIAEGLLNMVGFEKGVLKLIELLKKNRYLIIHDEFRDHNKKIEFIQSNNCKVLNSFRLDEHVWWNDYYKCLDNEISSQGRKNLLGLFKTDLDEIELYKQDPSQFHSVYYVIKKLCN